MNRSIVAIGMCLLLAAVGVSGCATTRKASPSNRPRAFALAVTVHGSLQPTPQQWALIQAKFSEALATRGWVLVSDISLADHILRVDFTPSPSDPESSGRATVLGVRRNPYSIVARQGTSPYPSSAFGYSHNGFWSFSNISSFDRYYGFDSFYNTGYSTGWTSYTPEPSPKPHHPRRDREFCPPDHISRPDAYVHHRPSGDETVRPPPSDYGRWSGERSSSRSDRSDRYASRTDSSHSWSNHNSGFSSHSSYEPTYHSPSYSDSSASSASSSSSSAAAAAVSESAPPVSAASASPN